MNKTKVLLAALIIAILSGCSDKKELKREPEDLGEYVYVDQYNVVHSSRYCIVFPIPVDDIEPVNGKSYDYGVLFVHSMELPSLIQGRARLCPHCVNDHQADQIEQIYKGWENFYQKHPQQQYDEDMYDGRN